MILFFDTETTGLPVNWKAPVTDLNNWPRLVQLAYLVYDINGNRLSGGDYIIKPNGFTIPLDACKIHGITTERATRDGRELKTILQEFEILIRQADYIVAHNMQFDERIVGAEFLRNSMVNSFAGKETICTKEVSTNYCAIPSNRGYKWPKLSELHQKLFNTGFEEAHNAAVDIDVTAKCFWKLKDLGIVDFRKLEDANKKEDNSNDQEILYFKNILDKYCLKNELREVPLGAKAQAISFLETKFKQLDSTISIQEELDLLQWDQETTKRGKNSLSDMNSHQQDFLFLMKRKIIDEHKNFSLFKTQTNEEDKIMALSVLAIVNPTTTDSWILLVKHTYNYYLYLYYDYLPEELKPQRPYRLESSKKATEFSTTEVLMNDTIEQIANLVQQSSSSSYNAYEKYRSNIQTGNGSIFGGDSESIIKDLLEKTDPLLKQLQHQSNESYIQASQSIVEFCMFEAEKCMNMIHILEKQYRSGSFNAFLLPVWLEILKLSSLTMEDTFRTNVYNYKKNEFKKFLAVRELNISEDIDLVQSSLNETKNTGCFIATMAYGDYHHPKVMILRDFRDRYLQRFLIGRLFISGYYFLSPKVVNVCKNNKLIIKASQACLDFLIKYILKT